MAAQDLRVRDRGIVAPAEHAAAASSARRVLRRRREVLLAAVVLLVLVAAGAVAWSRYVDRRDYDPGLDVNGSRIVYAVDPDQGIVQSDPPFQTVTVDLDPTRDLLVDLQLSSRDPVSITGVRLVGLPASIGRVRAIGASDTGGGPWEALTTDRQGTPVWRDEGHPVDDAPTWLELVVDLKGCADWTPGTTVTVGQVDVAFSAHNRERHATLPLLLPLVLRVPHDGSCR